jgi:hypothetical protein
MIELLARSVLGAALALTCCAAPPADAPPAAPLPGAPGAGTPPSTAEDAAQDLLRRLETAAAGLRDFRAEVTYWKRDAALDREIIYSGRVIYQAQADGTRRFAIVLDFQIVNSRKRTINKQYVFDGSWLIELDHDEKLCHRRQIVPPGEHFDPLKLGEGPFPLPIGQRAREINARFTATSLAAPQDPTLARGLAEVRSEGLLLVPRPGTEEEKDIRQVEIFYDSGLLLPVGLSLTETGGDRKTVVLRNLTRNQGVDDKLLAAGDCPKGWRVVVEPFR